MLCSLLILFLFKLVQKLKVKYVCKRHMPIHAWILVDRRTARMSYECTSRLHHWIRLSYESAVGLIVPSDYLDEHILVDKDMKISKMLHTFDSSSYICVQATELTFKIMTIQLNRKILKTGDLWSKEEQKESTFQCLQGP